MDMEDSQQQPTAQQVIGRAVPDKENICYIQGQKIAIIRLQKGRDETCIKEVLLF
jgi:hypothetical protein